MLFNSETCCNAFFQSYCAFNVLCSVYLTIFIITFLVCFWRLNLRVSVYVYFNFNVAAHNDDDERRRQMSVTISNKQKC